MKELEESLKYAIFEVNENKKYNRNKIIVEECNNPRITDKKNG